MPKPATLRIQMWGNSLAVRIPSAIARSARLVAGQVVEVAVQDAGVAIVPVGSRGMTLAERLRAFSPERHGCEAMATRRVGREAL